MCGQESARKRSTAAQPEASQIDHRVNHNPRPTRRSWRDVLLANWHRSGFRGALMLSRFLRKRNGLLFRTRAGAFYHLDPNSYIDRIVIRDGDYESEVRKSMVAAAQPDSTVWDIGANFGLHATGLGMMRPDLQIIAFEPNPREHTRLLQHRAWNAPHIATSTVALSDRAGLLPLHLGPEGNSGMTTLSPWSEATYGGTVMVAVARGDDLIAAEACPPPNVIKIDVEGHEAAVLRGLGQTLRQTKCHTVIFEDGPEAATEAKELLEAAGFKVTRLDRNEQSDHALQNFMAKKHPRT
jgi:FkbM family methyltransferase